MDKLQVFFLITSAIVLFLYGLNHFSQEMETIGKERLHGKLNNFVSNRWRGFALGATFTAAVQSSSAASALAVSLVNAGLISFQNSLAILFGANVGTTITAQIVALKLTGIGPFFITIGFICSLFLKRYRPLGRVIFYFGFIFFSLNLISSNLSFASTNETLLSYLQTQHTPLLAISIGAFITFILQSSSVSTGIIVLMVQQQALPLETAGFLIMGSNIGTTGTALIASMGMNIDAKRAAHANLMFNILGVIVFWPLLIPLLTLLKSHFDNAGQIAAFIHLAFNLTASCVFLIFLKKFSDLSIRFSRRLGS